MWVSRSLIIAFFGLGFLFGFGSGWATNADLAYLPEPAPPPDLRWQGELMQCHDTLTDRDTELLGCADQLAEIARAPLRCTQIILEPASCRKLLVSCSKNLLSCADDLGQCK